MASREDFENVINRIRETYNELLSLKVLPEGIDLEKSSFGELEQFLSEITDQLKRRKIFLGILPPYSMPKKFTTREWQEYERERRKTGKSCWSK